MKFAGLRQDTLDFPGIRRFKSLFPEGLSALVPRVWQTSPGGEGGMVVFEGESGWFLEEGLGVTSLV